MDFEGTLAALYTQLRSGQISDAHLEQQVQDLLDRERRRLLSAYPPPMVPPGVQPTAADEAKARLADQAQRYVEFQETRARLYAANHRRFVDALTRRRKLLKDTWS